MAGILVLNFGGQYCHLIARRVREMGVHSDVLPFDASIEKIKEVEPEGIIFSGGPSGVYEKNAPKSSEEVLEYALPPV